MGRVNVEERFFAESPRTKRVAELMGWHHQRAKGCILDLWYLSQEAMEVRGTAADIAFWAQVDPGEEKKIVKALSDKRAAFIKKKGKNCFEIAGNADQIGNKVKSYDKQKKGGLSTHEKWKRLQERSHDARLEAGSIACSEQATNPATTTQFNSIQPSTTQVNSPREETPRSSIDLKPDVKRCVQTWEETLRAFKLDRPISRAEEEQIVRGIMRHGAETVELALYGYRYEKPVNDWKPSEHVSIGRVFGKDKAGNPRIDKFLNYGISARKSLERTREIEKRKEETEAETQSTLTLEEIRAILAEAKIPKRDSELITGEGS